MTGTMQNYLDNAMAVLDNLGIVPKEGSESKLATLLQDVIHVDEPKVLAIAKVLKYKSTFNELARNNIKDVRIADRFGDILRLSDSISEDMKTLLTQLEDGVIDNKEKFQNAWMRLTRGTTAQRYDKIIRIFKNVSSDTENQLKREKATINGYIDISFALKDAATTSYEVLKTQENNLKQVEEALKVAAKKVQDYSGGDLAEKSRLEMARDEAQRALKEEDRIYQLIKNVAEDISNGYNEGEAVAAKLNQIYGMKEQVYSRSISYFEGREHVFTLESVTYTSMQGLHETTQTLEAMKKVDKKGIEDIVEVGKKLEDAALKAAYGPTIDPPAVKRIVDDIVRYQTESRQKIAQLRIESSKAAEEVTKIVEDGKQRSLNAVTHYQEQSKATQ